MFSALHALLAAGWNAGTRIIAIMGALLLVPGVLVYLHASAAVPLAWQRKFLPTQAAKFESGSCYILPLGINWMSQADGPSAAEIFENGKPLTSPNAAHDDIINKGRGRFSVWEGYLYFSASDNSNPQQNGRVYELNWPTPVSLILKWISYIFSVAGLSILSMLACRRNVSGNSRRPPRGDFGTL
jgi:hypothetical protein